jgi:hypothetical protein
MNHIKIPHTGRDLYIPADLSECDKRQYIEMSALILQYQCGQIDYETLRVHAVYKLLDMKQGKATIDDDLKFSNIYQISLLIDSFFETDDNGNKVIKQYYINNHIDSFRGGFADYYGPSDEFNNVTFGEYIDGLGYFIDFRDTGDFKFLYLLLSTFYRKGINPILVKLLSSLDKFDGDTRLKYNPASVAARAVEFEKQHIGIVFGFYLWFASMQKYITTAVLMIEGREIDLSVLFDESLQPKQKESDLPSVGMKGIMYSFAESGVYGSIDSVRSIPIWEAMVHMYHLAKKNKDYEANQPK